MLDYMPKYENEATELINGLVKLVNDPLALDNFEMYLGYHFKTWLEKFATTPEDMVAEIREFASIIEEY